MSHQVVWTKLILETFISEGNLTHEEEMLMRTRCAGMTVREQADMLHVSESTIHRMIKRMKHKYDVCQKYSLILPKRKSSEEERYMDTH